MDEGSDTGEHALCEGDNVGTKREFQEAINLRDCGWEGLPPPPPVFTMGDPNLIGADRNDAAIAPAVIPLGLPNRDPEPQIIQPPPLEPVPAAENDMAPASPVDPTVIIPHDTFYHEDGNVEVLCGNTLFRAHTSILSFHSPALRRMFAQATLTTAESPNGCPRISSTDTARDFVTLLKIIYLPGCAAFPLC